MMSEPGSLRLPPDLRPAIVAHLEDLRRGYTARGLGGRTGFGQRPALLVIDLGKRWVDNKSPLGSDLESVVEQTCKLLRAARQAEIPIFFTTMGFGEDDPLAPNHLKVPVTRALGSLGSADTELDPRLERRPTEKLIVKKYASAFKGTDLHEMLATLGVDTLIVTGCSTSHCVYATCRDATSSLKVVVPEDAVGDRCELFHLVALLDIDLGLGDTMPTSDVVDYLEHASALAAPAGG
jgi:maleamate amidohydrolase